MAALEAVEPLVIHSPNANSQLLGHMEALMSGLLLADKVCLLLGAHGSPDVWPVFAPGAHGSPDVWPAACRQSVFAPYMGEREGKD